jgi:hypothetical protein
MKKQKNKEIIICNRTLLLIITNVNYVLHYKFYHPLFGLIKLFAGARQISTWFKRQTGTWTKRHLD